MFRFKPAGHHSSLLWQIPRNALDQLRGFLEAALKPATCARITFVEIKTVSLVGEFAASLFGRKTDHAKRPFASACVTLTVCFDMFANYTWRVRAGVSGDMAG